MNKYILFILGFFLFVPIHSQWLREVGLFLGGSNYSGDIGRETFIYPNRFAASAIYKNNINKRLALRITGSYFGIYDDDAFSANIARQQRNLRFTNEIIEFATGIEINYWDYDITERYEGFTPYMFFEVGAFYYHIVVGGTPQAYTYSYKISYSIPFGLGLKARLDRRFSITAEARAQYAFADDIDYNYDRIYWLRFGNPNTNDWYFFTGMGLTYSFGRPPCAVEPQY